MLDTGTVRLVILLGMFLVFAGDYNTMIASIWGGGEELANRTETGLKLPEGPPKEGLGIDRVMFGARRDEENGRLAIRIRIPGVRAFGDTPPTRTTARAPRRTGLGRTGLLTKDRPYRRARV